MVDISRESSIEVLEGCFDACESLEMDSMNEYEFLNLNQQFGAAIVNSDEITHKEIDTTSPRKKHSLARLRQQSNPDNCLTLCKVSKSEPLYLNIPCPKCQEGDCFWHCQKCSERLRFKENIIFCNCSTGIIQDFEFCCINKCSEFIPYENDKVSPVLERLTLLKSINILLLGSSGVGKTTFINSLANYLTFETLEEAENNKLPCLIPTCFQIFDQNDQKFDVKIGKENECESFATCKSATRSPQLHSVIYNNVVINLIDTPGLCDTSGINKDKENFNQILSYICSFPELHGICIMLKSDECRTNVELKYCIKQLLLHFHKKSIKNLVFCFTRSRGKVAQNSPTTVSVMLEEINKDNGTSIEFSREISYSLDNEAFRYLCAKKNGVSYENQASHAYCQDAWDRSRNETFRLINHVLSKSPHHTNETVTLNTVRSIIIGLNKPLAIITTQIQKNKFNMESQRLELQKLTGKEKDFQSKIKISQINTEKRPLNHWVVVCNKCAQVKRDSYQNDYKVYSKVCCFKCRAPWLYFCAELIFHGKCRKCSCPKSHHEHINYEYVEYKKYVEDEEAKKELVNVTSIIEKKKKVIERIETILEELNDEQKLVNKCAAEFSTYLKLNSILLNNKSHEDYLNMELENAKLIGKTEYIKHLKKALQDYIEEKEILDNQLQNSNTNSSSTEITAEDILAARDKLFALKWNGSTFRNIFDKELADPIVHHVSSIQQSINLTHTKKEKPWLQRTQEVLANVFTNISPSSSRERLPRIDDYGRALSRFPIKQYNDF